jgi:hypothetical protein
LAEVAAGEHGAAEGLEGVVVALGDGAVVVEDLGFGGGAADARVLVGGVAHAGGSQFGEEGFEGGAQFGGDGGADRAHPVGALTAHPKTAASLAVPVGEISIGVEHGDQVVGEFLEGLRAELPAHLRQIPLGALTRRGVHRGRDFRVGLAGDIDMLGPDPPGGLSRGQIRQHRFQRRTGHAHPRAQVRGLLDALPGRPQADPQPLGEHPGQRRGAQLARVAVGDQPGQDPMVDDRCPPGHGFATLQHRHQFLGREAVEAALFEIGAGRFDRLQAPQDRGPVQECVPTHDSNTSSTH